MRALCIRQPWASMIARGEKTIECRTWNTHFRGRFIIVASKHPKIEGLPCGVAVALATLLDSRPMTEQDEEAAKCAYEEGYYAWVLGDVVELTHHPQIKGQLGFFTPKPLWVPTYGFPQEPLTTWPVKIGCYQHHAELYAMTYQEMNTFYEQHEKCQVY